MDEKSLFLEALEKPSGDERAAWLREACGADEQLRGRIETLLREHDQVGGFLEKPAMRIDPDNASESSGDNLAASLEAGLAPAFGEDAAVVVGNAFPRQVMRARKERL